MADELLAAAAQVRERGSNLLRKTDEVTDTKELQEMQLRRRTDFEQALRMKRKDLRQWIRYAQFEVDQREISRARSIFERALQIENSWRPLWKSYIDMELREGNLSRAKNLFERVTKLLPRIEEFWLKYANLEERQGNFNAAKAVFERWLEWEPEPSAWLAFLGLLRRHNDSDQERFASQFVSSFPHLLTAWKAWASPQNFGVEHARQVYDRGLSLNGEPLRTQLVVAWAQLETDQKEYERARIILETAPSTDPSVRDQIAYLDRLEGIEQPAPEYSALRKAYHKRAANNPNVAEVWLALLSVDESVDVYEKAVASIEPTNPQLESLWLRYSVYSECTHRGSPMEILDRGLQILPKSGELWNARAMLALRTDKDFSAVRKIFGKALGVSGFDRSVLENYIKFERRAHAVDRERKVWELYCQHWPKNDDSWCSFADFELEMGESQRVRAIYKVATSYNPSSPTLWRTRCTFEADSGDFQYTRLIYGQWELSPTGNAESYIEHAMFEVSTGLGDDDESVDADALTRARAVFAKAHEKLPTSERLHIHEAQLQFEESYGTPESLLEIQKQAPESVETAPGVFEFRFKDSAPTPTARLLEKAKIWADSNKPTPAAAKLLENALKWAQNQ